MLGNSALGQDLHAAHPHHGPRCHPLPDSLRIFVDLGGRDYRSIEDFPTWARWSTPTKRPTKSACSALLRPCSTAWWTSGRTSGRGRSQHVVGRIDTRHPDRAVPPAVLVVIDNFADLTENYETLVESTIMPLSRSASAGVCLWSQPARPTTCRRAMPCTASASLSSRATPIALLDIVGTGALEIDDMPPAVATSASASGRCCCRPRSQWASSTATMATMRWWRPTRCLMGQHMAAHLAANRHASRHRPDPDRRFCRLA